MTKELIAENLGRILHSYKDIIGAGSLVYDVSTKGMLDIYASVLDWNGAPARNLSRIYLNDQVWDSFKREVHMLPITGYDEHKDINCLFLYSGYYWEVMNEDAIKRQIEERNNLMKNNQ